MEFYCDRYLKLKKKEDEREKDWCANIMRRAY